MAEWRLSAYEVIRPLGEGGMAHVYLARDVRLEREVAVKVLDARLAERPGFRERFLREARVAAALDHPHIVPIYDFGESPVLYLVMPYISGGSLQQVVTRGPLPPAQVASYGAQIADALAYAHQRNVVHRDVKPANMLLHADGRLMLTDFGLAKILDGTGRPPTPRGRPDAGTPEYMAPEQIEGRTDARSDIYGLGVVLYLLLTGRLPFSGASSHAVMEGHLYRLPEPPHRYRAGVTPAIEAVVMRALAKHADDRFQTASELGAALLAAMVAGDASSLPFISDAGPGTSLPPWISQPVVSAVPPLPPRAPGESPMMLPLPGRATAGAASPRAVSHGAMPHGAVPQAAIGRPSLRPTTSALGTSLPMGSIPTPSLTGRPSQQTSRLTTPAALASAPPPALTAPSLVASQPTGGPRTTAAPAPVVASAGAAADATASRVPAHEPRFPLGLALGILCGLLLLAVLVLLVWLQAGAPLP